MKCHPLTRILTLVLLCAAPALAEDFKTRDGQEFKDATITKSDAIGVTIMHADGITRVAFERLPDDVRARFNYDPAKAQAQAQAEQAAAAQNIQAARAMVNNGKINETLDKSALTISGRVLSVTDEGVLLTKVSITMAVKRDVVVQRNPLDGRPTFTNKVDDTESIGLKDNIFVYGVTGLVDDEAYSGVVYPVPKPYKYGAVSGANKTVRAFAEGKETAKRLWGL